MIVSRQHALRQDEARHRQSPSGHADDRGVEPDLEVVDLAEARIVLESGMSGQGGQVQPLPRGDIVGELRLGVREPEADRAGRQPVDDQIEIRLPPGDQPGPALMLADGSFRHTRCVRPAHRDVEDASIARSIAQPEIDLRSRVAAVTLRITAVEERDVLQHVAVDHRDRTGRAAVLDAAHRVEQVRRSEPVNGEGQMAEVAPTNRELAAEVVAGGDAGQDLHGAQRVVGEHAAQVEELGAAQHLRGRHGIGGRPEDVRPDRHGFAVGRRPLAEAHRQGRPVRRDGHFPAEEGVTHHGHVQAMGTRREAVYTEAAVRVGQDRLPRVLDHD